MIPVRIRRNVWMYPVYDINLDHVVKTVEVSHSLVLKDELKSWLSEQGFDSDPFSDAHTYYFDLQNRTATFFFADPKKAMLFKLTWA